MTTSSIVARTEGRLVEMYVFAACVYFVICFAGSLLVRRLQKDIPHDRDGKRLEMVWRLPGAGRLHTRVAKGEVVVVCGPSGSGKSTLIKCVNGLEPVQQGTITVDGIEVTARRTNLPKLRARIGMVFQHFELYPHMSVRENLCLAQLKVLGRSRDEAEAKTEKR